MRRKCIEVLGLARKQTGALKNNWIVDQEVKPGRGRLG